jgi:hypothetical protein
MASEGIHAKPLAIADHDIVPIALSDKSEVNLILETLPRNLNHINFDSRFRREIF